MKRQLYVHLLPTLTSPQELAGNTVVIIDVLRATTTIVHALAAGATEVIPCLEIADARELANKRAVPALLGGERRGLPIQGFDLGNSPGDYLPEIVGRRSIVMTTTNGTRAMMMCTGAGRVLIGSFCNLTALCNVLVDEPHVHLLCAGTQGQVSREDVLLAGALVGRIVAADPDTVRNDEAYIAAEVWDLAMGSSNDHARLLAHLCNTQGGRNVTKIGLQADIYSAAQIDKFNVSPELDVSTWSIRIA
jgi:2-phosphosulfolactate phosphatase